MARKKLHATNESVATQPTPRTNTNSFAPTITCSLQLQLNPAGAVGVTRRIRERKRIGTPVPLRKSLNIHIVYNWRFVSAVPFFGRALSLVPHCGVHLDDFPNKWSNLYSFY